MDFNLPEDISEKIRTTVVQDMRPSPFILHLKLFTAVVFGGIISLAICGQFGMGMTSWAEVLSHKIHDTMPPMACALICGTVYAVFPTLLLRLFLCSPLQFRIILKRRYLQLATWYCGTGVSLAIYGQHGQGVLEIISWSIAAISTSYLLALAFRSLIPDYDPLATVRH